MPSIYTTEADLIARVGDEPRYRQLSRDVSPSTTNKDRANAVAVGRMKSLLSKSYDVTLLTEDFVESRPELKDAIIDLELDELTKRADRRPEWIGKNGEAALSYFKDLAEGRAVLVDTDSTTEDAPPSNVGIFYDKAEGIFDTSKLHSPLMQRFKPK